MNGGPLRRTPRPPTRAAGEASGSSGLELPRGWPAAALTAILLVTAAWWALALWPAGEAAPEWLARTRAVCFGAAPDGLPDGAGWAVLVGQPLIMLGILLAGWGRDVRFAARALRTRPAGRAMLLVGGILALTIPLGAAVRVAGATRGPEAPDRIEPATAAIPGAIDAPALVLTDQTGATFDLRSLRGRPVFVTFAFGHCETVCPTIVHEVAEVRRRAAGRGLNVGAVVVTLDPWRDTPSRLPSIATRWSLGSEVHLLSGSVPRVEATLDAWGVARRRDPRTGELTHARTVFVVDPAGRLAYSTSGGIDELLILASRALTAPASRSRDSASVPSRAAAGGERR